MARHGLAPAGPAPVGAHAAVRTTSAGTAVEVDAAFASEDEAAAFADRQGWADFTVAPYRPRPLALPTPPAP